MDLSKDGKLLWIYLITRCNHAGLIEINNKLCKLQTGITNIEVTFKELGNRMVRVTEQLNFIPKYIDFQYPGFPKSNVKQQKSAIDLLLKYNLIDPENLTLNKDLVKSYDNDNGTDSVIIIPIIVKTWRNDYSTYKEECRVAFDTLRKDPKFIGELQIFYSGVDIQKSLALSFRSYWGTEKGWKQKKKDKDTITLDWKATILNTLKWNTVKL